MLNNKCYFLVFGANVLNINDKTNYTATISASRISYLELLLLYSGTISFILRTVAISSNCFAISTRASISAHTSS